MAPKDAEAVSDELDARRTVHDGDWGVQVCRFRRTFGRWGWLPWRFDYEVWINQPNARRTRTVRLWRFAVRWQPALGSTTIEVERRV